jgi:N utilization substance protein B
MKNASPKGNFAPGHASDAREQALILLYEAESRSMLVSDVVREQVVVPHSVAVALALGVEEAQVTYDEMISSRAKGWRLERMPMIDRAVLRLALHELREFPDVPTAVIMNEAIELAKRFSTEDSGRFVNGILSALLETVRPNAK